MAKSLDRRGLIKLLNEDLAREYQAIIAYVNYSQVLKGAQYMKIAAELEKHATEELDHALKIAKQIDYLGGMPTVTPQPVKTSEKNEEMLKFRSGERAGDDRELSPPRDTGGSDGRVRAERSAA